MTIQRPLLSLSHLLIICLTFVLVDLANSQKIWNAGVTSTAWNGSSNWLPTGVPTMTDNVVVSGTNVIVRELSTADLEISFSSLQVGNQVTPNNATVVLSTLPENSIINFRSKAVLIVSWPSILSPWSYGDTMTIDQGGQMDVFHARLDFINFNCYGIINVVGMLDVLKRAYFGPGAKAIIRKDAGLFTSYLNFNAANMEVYLGKVYFTKSAGDLISQFENGALLFSMFSSEFIESSLYFSRSSFDTNYSNLTSDGLLLMENSTLSGHQNSFVVSGVNSGLALFGGKISLSSSNIVHNSSQYLVSNCSNCAYTNSNTTFINSKVFYSDQNDISYLSSSNLTITSGDVAISGNTTLHFNESSLSVKDTTSFSLQETSSLNAFYSDFNIYTYFLLMDTSRLYTFNSTFYVYSHILVDNSTRMWIESSTVFVDGSILSKEQTEIGFINSQVSINGNIMIVGSMNFTQGLMDIKGVLQIVCPDGVSVGTIDSIIINVGGYASINCLTSYTNVTIFVGGEMELTGGALISDSNIISSNRTKVGSIFGVRSNITVLAGDLVVLPNSLIYLENSTNSGKFLSDPSTKIFLTNSRIINNGLMLIDSELSFDQSNLINMADLVITSNIVKNGTVNVTQTFDNQGMMNVTNNIAIQIDFANSGNLSIGNSSNTNNLQVDGNFNTSSVTANVGLVVKSATDFSSLNVSQTATLAGELTIRVVKNLTRENVTIPVMTYDNVQGSHSKINIITYDPETGEEDSSPACSISSNQGEKGINVLISNCKEESLVSKLGAGAIAGIVIGCAAAVVLSFTLYHFRERIRLNIKLLKTDKESFKMNNINQ
ncbi:hypothetical protein DFA_08712 [Cavenderia fasciculata]|uniref:Transmembrane protein n=1 Tax=Cavenderia fasciculata TaxID=261658 RepID=F4Q3V9_CACFS|nr:uncharacterized protein DFA_08712 [Cavenderia fasciculata]EGG17715.1 hypothetical protein DFA_08712 [Cavenderia fasciculata]|eukprot:XP_004356199.1 hypothetical protein DFA_08712 [Cavenderia fasciculata]